VTKRIKESVDEGWGGGKGHLPGRFHRCLKRIKRIKSLISGMPPEQAKLIRRLSKHIEHVSYILLLEMVYVHGLYTQRIE